MTGLTRRSVLAAVGVGLASAGCLSDAGGVAADRTTTGGQTPESSTERTTREPPTEKTTGGTTDSASDPTETDDTNGDWIAKASNTPEPDHEITVENELSGPRTLRVAVVREATGETVFETTEEFPRGESILYNLREADPDGVERFRVCAELVASNGTATAADTQTPADSKAGATDARTTATDSPRRDCATIATNECHGNAHVTLREDGSLSIVYAIC
ncbi:hypothetical protein M0R89_01790 [Halorussus limi]|uniref:Uncharacterized protein n=1 Tax=Halorussus limi TaxID=2938695 RepID=A0A8U0HW19_9EURY|nr:hypothetical protein [Halorussus limi]UPV74814.1 hypothetical protein M0R89_01790 [Halorussus limi]